MVVGKGLTTNYLTESEIHELCSEAFEQQDFSSKKVLVIIPDHTRSAPMDVMFRTVYSLLADRVKNLDFLVALGTHPLMSEEGMSQLVGLSAEERKNDYPQARFFNHSWDNPAQLAHIGTISGDEVADISLGLLHEKVNITINKMVFDYDHIMIIGPTFPHEVVGFSGGNKYLFPGIAGQEIIDMFHWLGALITSPVIIGSKYTPVRRVVDRATEFLPFEPFCISLVVKDDRLAGLYAGPSKQAWAKAADLSDKLHIIYKDHPYTNVLSRAPKMYDDLWTGAKCMYKLEPVVADGGELIIYAPHIKEISVTHGEKIRKVGYHVRDYFLKQPDKFNAVPGGVRAHSTHVKGVGQFENGVEKPRINVVLASQIPKDVCEHVNLGYRDPDSIDENEYKDREDEGYLYVPKSGELLYRLKDDPFRKE